MVVYIYIYMLQCIMTPLHFAVNNSQLEYNPGGKHKSGFLSDLKVTLNLEDENLSGAY